VGEGSVKDLLGRVDSNSAGFDELFYVMLDEHPNDYMPGAYLVP
jgi:hypothetical protein